MAAPLGGGRSVWTDDADFDVAAHVTIRACPAPGDRAALLDAAADLAMTRLPRDRPLWRLTVVTDLADGGVALVLVAHHALSDGIGGLAVLARLMDGAPPDHEGRSPVPARSAADLRTDALRGRAHALTQLPRTVGRFRASVTELGIARPDMQRDAR